MGIIAEIGGMALSGPVGGILGMAGSFVGRLIKMKEQKQAFAFEQARWAENGKQRSHELLLMSRKDEHELKLHKINMEAAQEEFERSFAMSIEETSREGLKSSYAAQQALVEKPGGSQVVIDILRFVRPFLTVLAALIVGIMFFFVDVETKMKIAAGVLFLMGTSYTWWFGDRNRMETEIIKFKKAA